MEKDFATSFMVSASAEEAFQCINDVRGWWTKNLDGSTHHLDDEFSVQFGDVHYSRQKIVELVPNRKVVWLVTESRLNFVEDKEEWTGTKIIFEILETEKGLQVQFTHQGLVPKIECFKDCSKAWSQYVGESLFQYVQSGGRVVNSIV